MLFIIVVIALAWGYDFLNGANDQANSIATTVATRALSPVSALILASVLNLAGAFVTQEVAKTIGKGIIPPDQMTKQILIAGLMGAITWAAFCTWTGIPISVTHALVGGLMGAGIAYGGVGILEWGIIGKKILLGIVLAPTVGFLAGGIILIIMFWIFRKASPKINKYLRRGQIFTSLFMAFTHGMNDTQNAMGVVTAALVMTGYLKVFHVPPWVIVGSGFFMASGTFIGGWRVMKTLGWKIAKLTPVQALSAELGSALVIGANSLFGMPISTTHVVSSAVIGGTATQRLSQVKWIVAGKMIVAWIVTVPGAGLIGVLSYWILNLIF